MHSALFTIEIPQKPGGEDWSTFLRDAGAKLRNEKGAIQLAENVWLMDCQQSIRALAWLVAIADRLAMTYGILQFEHAPQWLPGGFDPSTIQGRSAGS